MGLEAGRGTLLKIPSWHSGERKTPKLEAGGGSAELHLRDSLLKTKLGRSPWKRRFVMTSHT